MHIGIQPFTIRDIDEPLPQKLERVARARFEGIELGPGSADEETVEALEATGLTVSSMGSSLQQIEDELKAHVDAGEAFGAEDVVVMWIDEERFETRDAVEDTAADLEAAADRLADHGLSLHYHNHDHEFVEVEGRPALELLYEETEALKFELDLGWAGTGGVDPAAFLERIGDRVTHAHVKDMAFEKREFVTFGEGDLDVESAVETARDVGVEWLIFENDQPVDPVAEPSHASLILDQFTGHI